VNINQNISDNPAEKDSAGFYDPSTESFPTSLEGKVLFYIAIAFSVFQVITAAHLLDLPSQILRAVHVGFLGLLGFPLVCALKKQNSLFKILSWCAGILSFVIAIYQTIEYTPLITRYGDLLPTDIFFGVIALILVLAAAWIVMGYALTLIASIFLLYCFLENIFQAYFSIVVTILDKLSNI